jgi:hypothetical protein
MTAATMSCVEKWFKVDDLEIERLLTDWRWLCPAQMSLLAKNLFGELFLMDETGSVPWLNTTVGKLSRVANSKVEFLEMAETNQKRQEWFVEQEAVAYADRGFVPSSSQCIGFAVPAVFAEGGTPDTAFVVDIYEHVSFLGDLHQQLSTSPDGSKVRLRVVSKPSPKS